MPTGSVKEEERYLRKRGYLLGEKFSAGAFSTIHLALKISNGEKIAVKIIDLRTATREYRRYFLPREISNVAELHHPNIIKVEQVGRSESKAYIVMAYANTNLRKQIAKYCYIKEEKARMWFRQLTSALEYLHRRGVVHRDLKIENILVDNDQNIKLCDFGFSKLCLSDEVQGFNSRTFCGSLGYCAPEILQRVPYNPWKSDIWSLGVVLYKMVVGGMPFGDGNDLGSIRKIAKAQTRLLEFPSHPKLSDDCKNLIRSLLAFESDHRITLVDVFRSKWVNKTNGNYYSSVDDLSSDDIHENEPSYPIPAIVQSRNNTSVTVTTSDKLKLSLKSFSVLSKIRMRLPLLGGK